MSAQHIRAEGDRALATRLVVEDDNIVAVHTNASRILVVITFDSPLVEGVVMVAIATWAGTRSDVDFFGRTFFASIDEENAVTLVSESDIFKAV